MDRRGVEPRTSACKAGAFPLRHPPGARSLVPGRWFLANPSSNGRIETEATRYHDAIKPQPHSPTTKNQQTGTPSPHGGARNRTLSWKVWSLPPSHLAPPPDKRRAARSEFSLLTGPLRYTLI